MKEPKEIINFSGLEIHIYLDDTDTKGQFTMFKVVVNPGAKMGMPHYHEAFDETLYGLKGITTYLVDGKTIELGIGDYLQIPKGIVHGFSNLHAGPSEFLTLINPGIFGAPYFREIAEVLNAGGPPDVPRLKAILLKHGLVAVMQ